LNRRARRHLTIEGTPPAPTTAEAPPLPISLAAERATDGHTVQASLVTSTASTAPAVSRTTATPAPEPSAPASDSAGRAVDGQSISIEQLRYLWDHGASPVILDVRTDRTYDPSPTQARGALRLPPDHVVERASELNLPRDARIVVYCA
jgi:hypothetical protein